MSTITEATSLIAPSYQSPPGIPNAITAEQRIVIRNVNWELYNRLSDEIGERQHVYLAYDGKDLEIMTKGREHEDFKEFLGRFVNALAFELKIRCRGAGETTWKRPEIMRGLEADQCYYFDDNKLTADAQARARRSKDIADYPNPDMAIEIDLSPSQIDRPSIYAAMGVHAIWRFDGDSLRIEHLQENGTYALAESSRYLPVRAEEVFRWVAQEDTNDELAWEARLREWARTELASRRRDADV
jgi:Uma2 family endonuclease